MNTASNTLSQLQKQMDIISNNMANVDTTGFKRSESSFNDLLVQQLDNQPKQAVEVGRLTPLGIRSGNGAKLSQAQLVLTQGSLKTTDRDLDVALTKENLFFTINVQDENGASTRFTRDGAFSLSPVAGNGNQLQLVTEDGHAVLDENGDSITLNGPIKDLTISSEGEIIATSANGAQQRVNLGVVSVNKPQFLEKLGGNLYGFPANMNELGINETDIITSLTGNLRDEIGMKQRALESSNVDLSKEMTDLITAQRMYQFQSRSVTMADQMLGLVNTIRS
jgi:flagellar basal-body rod protein FlgG